MLSVPYSDFIVTFGSCQSCSEDCRKLFVFLLLEELSAEVFGFFPQSFVTLKCYLNLALKCCLNLKYSNKINLKDILRQILSIISKLCKVSVACALFSKFVFSIKKISKVSFEKSVNILPALWRLLCECLETQNYETHLCSPSYPLVSIDNWCNTSISQNREVTNCVLLPLPRTHENSCCCCL